MPPVAGSILWARHLLQRIEGPMQQFQAGDTLALATAGGANRGATVILGSPEVRLTDMHAHRKGRTSERYGSPIACQSVSIGPHTEAVLRCHVYRQSIEPGKEGDQSLQQSGARSDWVRADVAGGMEWQQCYTWQTAARCA